MTENNRLVVLSMMSLISVELIDGGDTVTVRFKAPDGRDGAFLVPRAAASALQASLAAALAQFPRPDLDESQ